MSSKKDDNEPTQTEPQDVQKATDDWRPDYFPTSAKPVFRKIGLLFLGILTLCLFLAYCSQNDSPTKDSKDENASPTSQEEFDETERENEIF